MDAPPKSDASATLWSGQSLPPPPADAPPPRTFFWSTRELRILENTYPSRGVPGCLPLLPGRSPGAIYGQALRRGLRRPAGAPGHHHWSGKPRYRLTPVAEEMIRRAYEDPSPDSINACARQLGWPRWSVQRQARRLGLAIPRLRGPEWTEPEDETLLEHAHRTPESLSRRLAKAGYRRSPTACANRLKRLRCGTGAKADPDHYTAAGLAELMGVNRWTVSGWIKRGLLEAKRWRGAGGDDARWKIHRREVRRFIVEHAAYVDLRKVDKFWFIDLLADRGHA